MKSFTYFATLLLGSLFLAWPAEPSPLRVAVTPFSVPVGYKSLGEASKVLPDLLAVELSKMARFELIEREKVQAICKELNLSASGLVARDSVVKLGKLLECDWLVSG